MSCVSMRVRGSLCVALFVRSVAGSVCACAPRAGRRLSAQGVVSVGNVGWIC